MKARVLFGVIGFVFVLLALYVFPPVVLEAALAALCVLATYEVLGSTKLVHNRLELILCGLVSLLLAAGHSSLAPFSLDWTLRGLAFLLLVGSFLILLRFHDSMNASQVPWAFFGALLVPYLLPACCASSRWRSIAARSSCCCRCSPRGARIPARCFPACFSASTGSRRSSALKNG